LAIFREIHQVQGFIDFDRGKFGLGNGGSRDDNAVCASMIAQAQHDSSGIGVILIP
jgi:hypothetical protein